MNEDELNQGEYTIYALNKAKGKDWIKNKKIKVQNSEAPAFLTTQSKHDQSPVNNNSELLKNTTLPNGTHTITEVNLNSQASLPVTKVIKIIEKSSDRKELPGFENESNIEVKTDKARSASHTYHSLSEEQLYKKALNALLANQLSQLYNNSTSSIKNSKVFLTDVAPFSLYKAVTMKDVQDLLIKNLITKLQLNSHINNLLFVKQGGKMNKFQQGGQIPQDIQIVAQVILVMALQQGLLVQPEQAVQLAAQLKLSNPQAFDEALLAGTQMLQLAQLLQAQIAKKGAKLNYLRTLQNKCPAGQELSYFKVGGKVCSKCVAMKEKAQKAACGTKVEKKCSGGVSKAMEGIRVEMAKCGKKVKKALNGVKENTYVSSGKPASSGYTHVLNKKTKKDYPIDWRGSKTHADSVTTAEIQGAPSKKDAENMVKAANAGRAKNKIIKKNQFGGMLEKALNWYYNRQPVQGASMGAVGGYRTPYTVNYSPSDVVNSALAGATGGYIGAAGLSRSFGSQLANAKMAGITANGFIAGQLPKIIQSALKSKSSASKKLTSDKTSKKK